jgi:hypothetical protein
MILNRCHRRCFPFVILVSLALQDVGAQTRDEKVIRDREAVSRDASWLYDDIQKGFEAAAKSKKPLMVVLRCIP